MSLDDWHLMFVSVCLVLILVACIPVVVALLPSRGEPYFALAVLGEEGMTEHYYPGDDPQIEVGEEVRWTVYLYNHMWETKYIAIRIKLQNSTMSLPNSSSCTPSSAPVIYELRHVLLVNETWLYPFDWSLIKVDWDSESILIEGLMINGEPFQTYVKAVYGGYFRMVLELWVYEEESKGFNFGWVSNEESYCVWNQVLFNATTIQPK